MGESSEPVHRSSESKPPLQASALLKAHQASGAPNRAGLLASVGDGLGRPAPGSQEPLWQAGDVFRRSSLPRPAGSSTTAPVTALPMRSGGASAAGYLGTGKLPPSFPW